MQAELRDALEFLYADSAVSKKPRSAVTLDVARHGTAVIHVLLNTLTPGASLRFSVRAAGKPVRDAHWFRLIDVPVESNTGPVGFIEKDGQRNPFVIRRAPFRVFDATEPVDETVRPAGPILALRLHLPANKPGRHTFTILVQAGAEKQTLSLTVRVHAAAIPPVGRRSFFYTNWFTFDGMAKRHGLQPWSEAHWRMIRRYADLMVHGRQNTFWLPLGSIFSVKDKTPVLNRLRLRRIVKTFTDAGMHYIEGGHVAGRHNGDWKAETFDTVLVKERATSPEGNAVLAAIARQLVEEIDRNG